MVYMLQSPSLADTWPYTLILALYGVPSILSCIRLCVGVYFPRLILKITRNVATMSKMMMVRRIPMTSPTCDWSCTVCTLLLVVVVLAVVEVTGRDAWLLEEGALLVDSVLNSLS